MIAGFEVMFLCPGCQGRAKRLALLRHGVGCAKCLDIRWGSERESKIARLVRRIDEIAGTLELQDWYEVPRAKPKGNARCALSALVQRRQLCYPSLPAGDAGSGAITGRTCTKRCWRCGGDRIGSVIARKTCIRTPDNFARKGPSHPSSSEGHQRG